MKIPVVKLTPKDKSGTPEGFEAQYEKRRRNEVRISKPTPQPGLRPIENPSMAERMADFGISES